MKNEFDKSFYEAHWMPFTGNRQFKKDPRIIRSANGHYYRSADGRQIFDGLSGLWTTGAGHCRSEITHAITEQLNTLDYSPAFQFGHDKSFEVANRLVDLTPDGLDYAFFSASGSESVETALKLARGYWRKRGQPGKTKLVGRVRGYHGVNFGGISVGGIGPNRTIFGQGIDADHLPHTILPETLFSKGLPETGAHLANELENIIALHDASNVAAVIVEPMAGSGGVIPPPKGYLKRLREICDQHDILLIFDEVITAFGRVGSMTGAEEFGVTPDIMCLAKQITNGVVPMGATMVKADIYNTFMDAGGHDYMVELSHGYTNTAHPVACAAALASLDLLESEQYPQLVKANAPIFEEKLHSLKGLKYVADIRNYGFAGALTLEHILGEPAKRPIDVATKCWEKGFYVRSGGDAIQLGLPFATTEKEIESLINAIGESIEELS